MKHKMITLLKTILFFLALIGSTNSTTAQVKQEKIHARETQPLTQKTWSLTGRVINISSICNIPDLKLLPKTVSIAKDSEFTITLCGNLESEFQQKPLAIIVNVQNSTKTSQTLSIPLLSDFIIRTKKGSYNALALCYPWVHLPVSKTSIFTNKISGKYTTGVHGKEQIELLYLAPKFIGEATIEILNLGSFKIDAGDNPL